MDIMFPIEINESWKTVLVYDNFKLSDTLTITCIGKKEPFYTPIGIFTCYVYHYKAPAFIRKAWHGYGLSHTILFPTTKCRDSRLIEDEYFLFLAPNIGYVGLIEIINGVVVWKRSLLDYFVRLKYL